MMSRQGAYQFSEIEASSNYWVRVGLGIHDVGSTSKSRWAFIGGNNDIPLGGSSLSTETKAGRTDRVRVRRHVARTVVLNRNLKNVRDVPRFDLRLFSRLV